MKVLVPTSINVKELVNDLNQTPTRSENLKNKFYYFLSKIVSTNDNFKLNEKNEGFRNISSVIMRKVMSRKDYYLILEILTNPADPMIESNNSWFNSKVAGVKGYCKGYRITEKYNTGEVVFKTLPKKFGRRILRHLPESQERMIMTEKYKFLLDQFQNHPLSFDPQVFDFILEFGLQLLDRVENNNEYQTKMIYNLIGRWLYFVERIQKKDIWSKVSPDNHRLNSSLTNLNKLLRPFLLCNGKPLIGLDISSSQPYILSSVMSQEFVSGTNGGFNLCNVYPELYNELVSNGYINDNRNSSYTGNTPTFCTNDNNSTSETPHYNADSTNYDSFSSSAAGVGQFAWASSHTNTPSFMWGQFYDIKELESITQYQQSPFDQDFYKNLIKTNQTLTGHVEILYQQKRQKMKEDMMLILFDDKPNHRNNIENIATFRQIFPGVEKWISEAHKIIGKTEFSYLLQRCESYLVLNTVSREFHDKFPPVPLFTIHDAIYTYEEYHPDLMQLLLGRFYDITGVKVGAKTKPQKINPESKPEDINEKWNDIKPIKTSEKYQEVSCGVFTSNIERGTKFLKVESALG